ncbi:DUF6671 family protein [Pseudanabaena sp. PCC 6802]|uniref:DUF6671 family protein n=1 Tax=Pseudanabaena sp. PCC 6802 TaxID=118173 RepID=UPI00034C4E4F|nr:DUF6671 family protein [Pseudanabaena sp. PCC 6802]
MRIISLFENRTAVLATMHQKEKAIAPLLASEFGMKVVVPPDFNTDRFGTFTREIERPGTQIEAARLKAREALNLTGETIAIASEGSFYPHPAMPLIACNREIVLLRDRANDLEIIGEEISTDTNYHHHQVGTIAEAIDFAQKIGFPEHGLVVMSGQNATAKDEIVKGITSEEKLTQAIESALQTSTTKTIHLETDMRAMYNPTRMKAIARATLNLIAKLHSLCPQCSTPGFDIVKRLPGLPCSWCSLPTSLIRCEIYQCQKCQYTQETRFPNGIKTADPSHCSYCNP